MSFSVGIVGLPNVGKSTLFKALTKKAVDIAPYPFTTIDPNVGVVQVPDERLQKIAEAIKPEKITPTIIEFVDIAGLVKGAHKGEGLGNQFLAHIRNCDAILEVIRDFKAPEIENVLGEINPKKEMETIKTELLMKDLETLENVVSKKEKKQERDDSEKRGGLEKVKTEIRQGKLISEINLKEKEKTELKEYQFLTQKPIFFIINTNGKGKSSNSDFNQDYLEINLKEEKEFSELSDEETKELDISSQLDKLILNCYNILDLITFYTIAGGKETRAWTLKKGRKAPEAGSIVHSDFEEKFIKAEVLNWEQLVKAGSRPVKLGEARHEGTAWSKAKEIGWLKTVGRDYTVQDGDVIEFKI